ncbi:MAG: lipopolysaccharide biosynthesis protein, partial [Verrucomicrobiaceae bacterium]|nr:lipopolysaccharide biosynthesis protein [Verrucomicrobiaceae bacterium]
GSAAHRDRSLRLAVITSLISKVGTIVLRLVSIPIAIQLLGMELFGVYTVITMAVGMMDMMHVGIGPALTKALSKAVARGDRETERTVFATSILLSVGLTLVAATVALLLLWNVPIATLFGAEFAPVADTMFRAALLGLFIIQLEMICIPFEMGRDGYQETRYTNAWGAAGNILGAVALLAGIWYFPTIEFLLLAVNGSIALAKLGNTCHLLLQRPYLFPRLTLFRRKLVRGLASDGIRFSITYILAAAMEYNLMAFLIGRHAGPEAVGIYNVMITIHFSLTGLIAMFTKPYWPALMDAFERRDTDWIIRTSNRLRRGGLGFALLAGAGLVAVGPFLLRLWAGDEFYSAASENFRMDRIALLAFAAYFALHIWRHINQTLALGIGWIGPVVRVVLAEALFLISAASFTLFHEGDIGTIYLVMAGSVALFSGWLFPVFFRKGRDTGEMSPPPSGGFLVESGSALPTPTSYSPEPGEPTGREPRTEFRETEGNPPAAELHR